MTNNKYLKWLTGTTVAHVAHGLTDLQATFMFGTACDVFWISHKSVIYPGLVSKLKFKFLTDLFS